MSKERGATAKLEEALANLKGATAKLEEATAKLGVPTGAAASLPATLIRRLKAALGQLAKPDEDLAYATAEFLHRIRKANDPVGRNGMLATTLETIKLLVPSGAKKTNTPATLGILAGVAAYVAELICQNPDYEYGKNKTIKIDSEKDLKPQFWIHHMNGKKSWASEEANPLHRELLHLVNALRFAPSTK
jgi:hypothetical protein